ncbi:MAG: 8-amino-7-oxononanoate synthase [Dissulfuribacterales bacterium]
MSTERRLLPRDPSSELLNFSSNDYLGLARDASLIQGAIKAMDLWGVGATGSRLMSGDLTIHHELEKELAAFKGTEAALLFGAGYLANTGVISGLISRNDVILADKLVHASILDGILLSRAEFYRFRHNDMGHLKELLTDHATNDKKVWIVAETLYSMDGDMAPIEELLQLKRQYNACLFLDEAHALGVFGENGEGLVTKDIACEVDVIIGTFGKAFGSFGAFAACSHALKHQLINHARSFIFSTALPPAVVGVNLAALRLMPKLKARRKQLQENMALLSDLLKRELGIEMQSRSQIIPIILGDNERCLNVSQRLFHQGLYVKAIRPPTVPKGSARLRISLTASHTAKEIHTLVSTLKNAL